MARTPNFPLSSLSFTEHWLGRSPTLAVGRDSPLRSAIRRGAFFDDFVREASGPGITPAAVRSLISCASLSAASAIFRNPEVLANPR